VSNLSLTFTQQFYQIKSKSSQYHREMASLPADLIDSIVTYALQPHVGRLLSCNLRATFDATRTVLRFDGSTRCSCPPPRDVVLRLIRRCPAVIELNLSKARWWDHVRVAREDWLTGAELCEIVTLLPLLRELDVSYSMELTRASIVGIPRSVAMKTFACWQLNDVPRPDLTPLDVVATQICALRRASVPQWRGVDGALSAAWSFAAPENKALFGNSIARFGTMLCQGAFSVMLDHSGAWLRERVRVGAWRGADATAYISVKFTPNRPPRAGRLPTHSFFLWTLEKQVSNNSWMVSGVQPLMDWEGYGGQFHRSGCGTEREFDAARSDEGSPDEADSHGGDVYVCPWIISTST
jgi:hypothetical protein